MGETPLRIAHVVEAWRGGTETYVSMLIRRQSGFCPDLHLLYSIEKAPGMIRNLPVAYHSYPSGRGALGIISAAHVVHRILEQIKPSVVHVHGSFAGVFVRSRCLVEKPPWKVIYCAHGWAFCQDVSRTRKWIYATVERWLGRWTDAIIHISRHELTTAMAYGFGRLNNFLVQHGVTEMDAEGRNGCQTHDRQDERLHLGFFGRLDRQKGFDLLVRALDRLTGHNCAVHVFGVFDREKGVAEQRSWIHYHGWVGQEEVDARMSEMDAILVPSRWEGFGLVVLEAMRCSKPVIVSDRGGLPELVIHGFNGFIFSFDNPTGLTQVLDSLNREDLRRMGMNARRVYESHYTDDRMFKETDRIYLALS